jgi:hypothetical protein
MAQAMYDVLRYTSGILTGTKYASDEEAPLPDRISGGVGTAGSTLSMAGTLMGGTTTGLSAGSALTGGTATGLTGAIGTGFMGAGSVLGAGAMGYGFGKLIDWGVGKVTGKELSTHLSEGMVGTVDDDIADQGMVVQNKRGSAGIEQANRAAMARAIAHTRTLPEQQLERANHVRNAQQTLDAGDPLGVGRMAMSNVVGHWIE